MKFKRLRAAALAMGLMVGGAVVVGESPAAAVITNQATLNCNISNIAQVSGVFGHGDYAWVRWYYYDFSTRTWKNFLDNDGWKSVNSTSVSPEWSLNAGGFYIAAYVHTYSNGTYSDSHFATTSNGGGYCYVPRSGIS